MWSPLTTLIRLNVVLKPFLARVFARVARLLGIPEIQHRLDHADAQLRDLRESHRTDPRFGTLERHLERRTQQQLTDHAALTQALAQQQAQQQQQDPNYDEESSQKNKYTNSFITPINNIYIIINIFTVRSVFIYNIFIRL